MKKMTDETKRILTILTIIICHKEDNQLPNCIDRSILVKLKEEGLITKSSQTTSSPATAKPTETLLLKYARTINALNQDMITAMQLKLPDNIGKTSYEILEAS